MSIGFENALPFGLDAVELPTPDRPGERAQDQQAEADGEGDQEEEDVHGGERNAERLGVPSVQSDRDSRAALSTTNSELQAMPSPAAHGGIQPTSASGMHSAL
jgi:hypothetical protein